MPNGRSSIIIYELDNDKFMQMKRLQFLSKAINRRNVEARYKYFDEDIDTIEWLDGTDTNS